jgi:hypothetical protein
MEERQELLDEILDAVENYFDSHCDEDGYDSFRDRVEDLQAMADGVNDPMVDNCIEIVSQDFPDIDVEEFRDEIENKLAELASDEL